MAIRDFTDVVRSFVHDHRIACTCTLGLAIAGFAIYTLMGRCVSYVKECRGTTGRTADVGTRILMPTSGQESSAATTSSELHISETAQYSTATPTTQAQQVDTGSDLSKIPEIENKIEVLVTMEREDDASLQPRYIPKINGHTLTYGEETYCLSATNAYVTFELVENLVQITETTPQFDQTERYVDLLNCACGNNLPGTYPVRDYRPQPAAPETAMPPMSQLQDSCLLYNQQGVAPFGKPLSTEDSDQSQPVLSLAPPGGELRLLDNTTVKECCCQCPEENVTTQSVNGFADISPKPERPILSNEAASLVGQGIDLEVSSTPTKELVEQSFHDCEHMLNQTTETYRRPRSALEKDEICLRDQDNPKADSLPQGVLMRSQLGTKETMYISWGQLEDDDDLSKSIVPPQTTCVPPQAPFQIHELSYPHSPLPLGVLAHPRVNSPPKILPYLNTRSLDGEGRFFLTERIVTFMDDPERVDNTRDFFQSTEVLYTALANFVKEVSITRITPKFVKKYLVLTAEGHLATLRPMVVKFPYCHPAEVERFVKNICGNDPAQVRQVLRNGKLFDDPCTLAIQKIIRQFCFYAQRWQIEQIMKRHRLEDGLVDVVVNWLAELREALRFTGKMLMSSPSFAQRNLDELHMLMAHAFCTLQDEVGFVMEFPHDISVQVFNWIKAHYESRTFELNSCDSHRATQDNSFSKKIKRWIWPEA